MEVISPLIVTPFGSGQGAFPTQTNPKEVISPQGLTVNTLKLEAVHAVLSNKSCADSLESKTDPSKTIKTHI